MTLLEIYIGRYVIENEEKYFVYFKEDDRIIEDQFTSLNEIYEKIVQKLEYQKFDKICFIPLKDETRIPVINPIIQSELANLENTCRESLLCALLPSPYSVWFGEPNSD